MSAAGDEAHAAALGHFPLARRGFVAGGLVGGFTMATTTVLAQAIRTDATGLVAGAVELPVADGHLPGYRARPEGRGPFPIVLVIEEIFGVHEYIRDVCRRLAHQGYLAVAPELYARIADLSTYTDAGKIVREVISKAPDATVLSDLDSTAAWAATDGGDAGRLATLGFCRGGRDVWMYAEHSPTLRCAVAFYGPVNTPATPIQPRSPMQMAAELHCPLLGLYGGQDTSIDQADVRAAQATARAAGKTVEIVVYPDAPHGFHADYRPSYHAADATDAWSRALAWLKRYDVA